MKLVLCLVFASVLDAATAPTGFPFASETLNYQIVWPSGLSLGEAHLKATHSGAGWNFELLLDAAVPAYAIHDRYTSTTDEALCSKEFLRETQHGSKKTQERIRVLGDGRATRETPGGGGTSELAVSSCAADALAFVFLARRELGQGRVLTPRTVLFGPGYPVQLEYAGAETISTAGVSSLADKIVCTITLPKTGPYRLEMFFARDAARTPLLLRAPFAIGVFAMEFVR